MNKPWQMQIAQKTRNNSFIFDLFKTAMCREIVSWPLGLKKRELFVPVQCAVRW